MHNTSAPAPLARRAAYSLANVNTGRIETHTLPLSRVAAHLGCTVQLAYGGARLFDASGRLAYVRNR